MSFSNVVGGKLKLKGKALDVRAGGMKKKKKREQTQQQLRLLTEHGGTEEPPSSLEEQEGSQGSRGHEGEEGREGQQAPVEDHRTPAEKRYHEQKIKLEAKRLAKVESKSHRQRVEEFNQYLANLSEHYDIPKVGPG